MGNNKSGLIKVESSIVSAGNQLLKIQKACLTSYHEKLREWWNDLDEDWKLELIELAHNGKVLPNELAVQGNMITKDLSELGFSESEVIVNERSNVQLELLDSALEKLTLARKIFLSRSHINLEPLALLEKLVQIKATYNHSLVSLKGIEDLVLLKAIIINSSPISNLEPLRKLLNLEYLNLGQTEVEDLEPILKLPRLMYLSIRDCPIKEIKQLSLLTNLVKLDCSVGQVRITPFFMIDLDILSCLRNLTHIDCRNSWSMIKNLEALAHLPNLEYINLSGCNIPETQIKNISGLIPQCKIVINKFESGEDLFYLNSDRRIEEIKLDHSFLDYSNKQ